MNLVYMIDVFYLIIFYSCK